MASNTNIGASQQGPGWDIGASQKGVTMPDDPALTITHDDKSIMAQTGCLSFGAQR